MWAQAQARRELGGRGRSGVVGAGAKQDTNEAGAGAAGRRARGAVGGRFHQRCGGVWWLPGGADS